MSCEILKPSFTRVAACSRATSSHSVPPLVRTGFSRFLRVSEIPSGILFEPILEVGGIDGSIFEAQANLVSASGR